MDRNEAIMNNLDISDRMYSISEELQGMSEILLVMYEEELKRGEPAKRYLMLSSMVTGYCEEIKELAKRIQ